MDRPPSLVDGMPASGGSTDEDLPPTSDETSRLAALHRLGVVDQPRQGTLDALARLAAFICDTPTAAINLVDFDRQWPAASYGYEAAPVAVAKSMCQTSIRSRDVSYTPDASIDARWSKNPHVTGELDDIRLYAAAPLVLPGGEVVGTVCAFSPEPRALSRVQLERLRDVAEQTVLLLELREQAERLGRAATRDSLTGLPNRALFEESLRLALARHLRGGPQPVVLFLDLDRFKQVNDGYGHTVGDELLRAIADRLLTTVRATDLLARLAGDELVVLCENAGSIATVTMLVERIRAAFSVDFPLSCGPIRINASIGVAFAEHESVTEVLARADADMYRDKAEHRREG